MDLLGWLQSSVLFSIGAALRHLLARLPVETQPGAQSRVPALMEALAREIRVRRVISSRRVLQEGERRLSGERTAGPSSFVLGFGEHSLEELSR